MKRTTPFSRILSKWAEHMNQDPKHIKLMVDGAPIGKDDTPDSLELENDDQIGKQSLQTLQQSKR